MHNLKKKTRLEKFFYFFFRGLTQVLRSAAGCQEKFENGDDGDKKKKWSDSYRNNHHLLDRVTSPEDEFTPGPSNHLLYYDAASLYPSSGTQISLFFHPPPPPHLHPTFFFAVAGVCVCVCVCVCVWEGKNG